VTFRRRQLPNLLGGGACLAIVGASARAAVESARRGGFSAIAADLFADADLARQAPVHLLREYPAELAAWLPAAPCDAWMYVGGLENSPRLLDRLAAVRPLWGNEAAVVRRVRSPRQLAACVRSGGWLYPESYLAGSREADAARRRAPRAWLWKPLRGAGGRGIRRLAPGDPAPPRGLVQRRIAGLSLAALYLGNRRTAICLGVTRQIIGAPWTGGGDFRYGGTLAPWPAAPRIVGSLEHLGRALAAEFGLVGLFGVDLLLDGDRFWVLEVNPRYTAGAEAIERATDAPLAAWHAAACLAGELPDAPPAPRRHAGKAILYAAAPLVVAPRLAEELLSRAAPADNPRWADVPPAGARCGPGQPILTVVAAGADSTAVEDLLRTELTGLAARLARGEAR